MEENVGKSLEDMGTDGKFLNLTATACSVRSRVFFRGKDTVNKTKKATNRLGKKIYQS